MHQSESNPASLFKEELEKIEGLIEEKLGVSKGANLSKNVHILRKLFSMNKVMLEDLAGRLGIISLDDKDYERLKAKIKDLLSANEEAAREQGIDLD